MKPKMDWVALLHARRFWMTLLGLAIIIANYGFHWQVPSADVTAFSGLIAVLVGSDAYVAGKHVQSTPSSDAPGATSTAIASSETSTSSTSTPS